MDIDAAERRWDELARIVAERVDRGETTTELATDLAQLERAVGVTPLGGADPSPCVSARRLARAQAQARRSERLASRPVVAAVEGAIGTLTARAPVPAVDAQATVGTCASSSTRIRLASTTAI